MDPVALLKGVAPPIGAALLLVSLGGVRLLPLAAAIGLWAAHGLLMQWPALPTELWHDPNGGAWLVWSVAAMALLSVLEHARALPARAAGGLGAAAAGFSSWLVLAKVASHWSGGEVATHVGVAVLVAAGSVLATRRTLRLAPAGAAPAVLFSLSLSLTAGLVVLGRSAFLGQLCGSVAAAVGAGVGTMLWRRPFALTAADGTWLGFAHAAFVLSAVHLAYLPWAAALPALAAPFVLAALPARLGAERPRWWTVVAALAVLAPLALALWLGRGDAEPYGY